MIAHSSIFACMSILSAIILCKVTEKYNDNVYLSEKNVMGKIYAYSFIYIHATIVSSFKRIEEHTDDIFRYDCFRIVSFVIICGSVNLNRECKYLIL